MTAHVTTYHRPLAQRDDWETPSALFNAVHSVFRFTLDAAAEPHNTKCARFFTPEIDGLAQDWGHETVWVNPPYGKHITAWVEKAVSAARGGATIVMLVPARTDTWWWQRHVEPREHRCLQGRIRFVGAPGRAPFGCALVVFRPSLAEVAL